MRLEFPDLYADLFKNAYERLQREMIMKVEIIKKQEVKLGTVLESGITPSGGEKPPSPLGMSGLSYEDIKKKVKIGVV